MPLSKQEVNINFSQGLDTKTDPHQVQAGRFLSLQNSIFDKAGRLTKRNGYELLSSLPNNTTKYLTTFNGNLTAIGESFQAYNLSNMQWIDKGEMRPISLRTLPAVRSSTYQAQGDSITAPNGLTCVAYTDYVPDGAGSVVPFHRYVVIDSVTGQNIVAPTDLPSADPTFGTSRVFLLGSYFVILFTTHPASYHLQYLAISTSNPSATPIVADIATSYIPFQTLSFDALTVNNRLYVAYNTTSGGQAVNVTYITGTLGAPVAPTTFVGEAASMFSIAADMMNASSPTIYVSYYDEIATHGRVLAINSELSSVLAPTTFSSQVALNIGSVAQNGSVTLLYEVTNTSLPIASDHVEMNTVTQMGTVGAESVLVRSIGLASKAFLYNDEIYFLGVYSTEFQPTYFLINGSGAVVAKLAYSNGGPYYVYGLPNISLIDDVVSIAYLYKDSIQAVNKSQGITNTAGVYSQLGVNIAFFNLQPDVVISSEIGQNLNLTGGFITGYDGLKPVEQGFFVYPDSVTVNPLSTGGMLADQQYYYQVTYEWSDNQGNTFRSAPSIPVGANVTGGSGSSSVGLVIPTLRLTSKTTNPVKIVIYRWSTGQQIYYQTTSLTIPILNDPTVDTVSFLDTHSDADILGNNILYTTGGVIENIAPPASDVMTLFNNRLFLVDAEDRNLLWFSKQVIEATPVEMSDLLTLYVAPSTASEGSTGPITALAPMDDKLVVFKENALGYISGTGPDNTGANSQYSDFTLINSVVGCTVQQSIVFMPQGLMFQSNKGIWLLGRDLSTQYIGAPVELLTSGAIVQSAVNIPSTNQVRFTLDTGITLVYDYFFGQWGTFTNVPAVSSTIYQNLHTYVNNLGQVLQESVGKYLDLSFPVLMSFTTSWINLAGVQGYERFYQMFLLGTYLSPFKLNVQLSYDYNPSTSQATLVTPSTPGPVYGGNPVWGTGGPWGGPSNIFESRVFPQTQKCESFQITINELFDSSIGPVAGAGLTLSGLNLVVGIKKGYRTSSAGRSFG